MTRSTKRVGLCRPFSTDGPAIRAVAQAAGGLDVNPAYAYALWVREFVETTVVACADGDVVGYATGFRRPREPRSLFIWQVAVLPEHRGEGLALRMLHHLAQRAPQPLALEATVAPTNLASNATFARFARDHDAHMTVHQLFDERQLGSDHEPEHLVRIAPLVPNPHPPTIDPERG